MRLAVAALHQVRGDLLSPERVEPGNHPRPKPRRLYEFCCHHPVRALLEQSAAGEDGEPGAAGTGVLAFALVVQANVAEQPGQHADMDRVMLGDRVHLTGRKGDAERFGELAQLGEQVLPLAHAQVVDEVVAAQLAELGR